MNHRMGAAIVLLFSLCFTVLFAHGLIVLAQAPTVGVSAGDVFYYNHVSFWSSDDPNATVPTAFSQINETEWVRVNITSVSGSIVYMENTAHFKDGNESTWNGQTDVSNGNTTVTFGFLVLPANLGANDTVNISPYTTVSILETVLRNYTGGERETNHFVTSTSSPSLISTTNEYFDKATGVVVEYSIETNQTSGSYTTDGEELIEIQNSTIFPTIPELPSSTTLFVLMVALSALLVTAKIGKQKTKPLKRES